MIGIGVAVLLFVVLGNPSAGGVPGGPAPGLLAGIGNALPNGAGTDLVRRIVYFDGNGVAGHVLVIAT